MATENERKFIVKKEFVNEVLLGLSGCEIEQGYLNKSINVNGRWSDVIVTVDEIDGSFFINITKEMSGTSVKKFRYEITEKDFLDIIKIQPDGVLCSKLTTLNGMTVRVRIKDNESAKLTIKGETKGISRPEFEYDIPLDDARLLMGYCRSNIVNKVRYEKEYCGNVFEIDVFTGVNDGLVLAEVEMDDPSETIKLPCFVGDDVSELAKYYNECIAAENASKYCRVGDKTLVEFYKNLRIKSHKESRNLTFVRFERWLTDAGNIALRVLEGFGFDKDVNGYDAPAFTIITPASYYKDEKSFVARMSREMNKYDIDAVKI